jgi:hypothetical protein
MIKKYVKQSGEGLKTLDLYFIGITKKLAAKVLKSAQEIVGP